VVATYPDGTQVVTSLRPRFSELDEQLRYANNIVNGRYLSDGPMEALVENWVPTASRGGMRLVMDDGQPSIRPDSRPGVGETIRLALPRARSNEECHWYDYSNVQQAELKVVGAVQFPSDVIYWTMTKLTVDGLEWTNRGDARNEQRYWTTNQLQVSWDTFRELTSAAGLVDPRPTALAVIVRQMAFVNETAKTIMDTVERGTVVPVPTWFETHDLLPEPVLMVPTDDIVTMRVAEPKFSPKTFTPPGIVLAMLVGLAYLTAGGLYAGNIYILLAQRKKELAIMKVLGARTSQVLTTTMTELGLLAVGGALAGMAGMSPMVLWQLASSRVTAVEVTGSFGLLALQTVGIAAVAALVFGGVPAYFVVTKTIEQVLYYEE